MSRVVGSVVLGVQLGVRRRVVGAVTLMAGGVVGPVTGLRTAGSECECRDTCECSDLLHGSSSFVLQVEESVRTNRSRFQWDIGRKTPTRALSVGAPK
jgi:hypothetical protein